jgi:hypothetical protein
VPHLILDAEDIQQPFAAIADLRNILILDRMPPLERLLQHSRMPAMNFAAIILNRFSICCTLMRKACQVNSASFFQT